jgi:hypothetical protein
MTHRNWPLRRLVLLALAAGGATQAAGNVDNPPVPDAPAQAPAVDVAPDKTAAHPDAPPPTSPKPGSGGGPPPPYTAVRWNEDYSYLADPNRRVDWLDRLKYIPLGDNRDVYLSLGGSARYRYELFNNNTFGAGPQDDTGYHLTRLFAHADLHVGPHLRGFVQLKSGMEDGRNGGPRPTDGDEFDLQQAFVDFRTTVPRDWLHTEAASSLTLRLGRQELIYGAQRLIGPLDWANVHRTFDGGKLTWDVPKVNTLDLLWVHPVIIENEEPNSTDKNASIIGAYDTLSLPKVFGKDSGTKLEVYGLYLDRDNAVFPSEGPGDEQRMTLGVRFSGAPKPFDFDIELDYQFGSYGDGDISAWAAAGEFGYTLAQAPFSPRPFLGFDTASGDGDPGDGDLGTFNQLYPTGHPHLGYIDAIGRQNILDARGGLEVTFLKDKPHAKKVTLRAEHHVFWRQSTDDAVYNAGGGVTRADNGSDESYVGGETDLLLNWQIERHWSAYLGYSHFFPGDFIQDTGPSGDIDFVYAAIQFTF